MTILETAMFRDVWWLALIKAVLVVVVVLTWTIVNVWFMRRTLARMMNRIGPDFNGPWGFFQTVAEGVKLLFKEDFTPRYVDKIIFTLSPMILAVGAFATWTFIPFGGEVTMFGQETRLVAMDAPVAVLMVLAVASVGIYGIVLAGWSSSISYSLLGSIRASAQMVSYEIGMGLALVSVFLWSGSMSTAGIVEQQATTFQPFGFDTGIPVWNAIVLAPAFLVYVMSLLAEINFTPFDFSEAEQELVSGYITEYNGFRYALYYLGEFINLATAAALINTLFLGGYRAPWPFAMIEAIDTGWWGPLWFVVKTQVVMFLLIWIRFSLPRLRYDKFMRFGWKVMIPVALGWVVIIAIFRMAQLENWFSSTAFWIIAAALVALLLVWALIGDRIGHTDVEPEPSTAERFDAFAGGYPVPPIGDQRPAPAVADVAAEPVAAIAGPETETEEA